MNILAVGLSMTPEYSQWRDQKVNDNIPMSNSENARSLEEHLQVLPSDIEIIKQDFEKRILELGKKIEQLEEEKMQLGLDVNIQNLEADKLRKRKNKAEKDLDSLKTDYKKLRRSMRTASLVCQNEKAGLKVRVTELEKSLHQYCSHNSAVELKASLSKIEELRGKVGELEDALQNNELRIELLDRGNE
ncbi:hypothetical protein Goklo_024802 [Gossypium klotzschianum]|uniref:Uncharacterized protein n=1 Tax=Gossypium klotzschianum TaxID=34286 RepID=A0A7J8WFR8_9ROSI|nr:hypothetical protein [Gossypium klotzschianum]